MFFASPNLKIWLRAWPGCWCFLSNKQAQNKAGDKQRQTKSPAVFWCCQFDITWLLPQNLLETFFPFPPPYCRSRFDVLLVCAAHRLFRRNNGRQLSSQTSDSDTGTTPSTGLLLFVDTLLAWCREVYTTKGSLQVSGNGFFLFQNVIQPLIASNKWDCDLVLARMEMDPGLFAGGGWLTHVARNCDSSFAGRMRVGMLVRGGGSSPTFCALRKQLPIVLKTRCFYFERQLQFCSFLGNNSLRTEGCACATATGWFCRVAGVGGGANVSLVIFHVQIENVQVWTIWLKVLHFFVRGDQNYGPGHRCRSRQNFGDA